MLCPRLNKALHRNDLNHNQNFSSQSRFSATERLIDHLHGVPIFKRQHFEDREVRDLSSRVLPSFAK
ncbi:hypothetical protein RISK_005167 [Rhodopirellula islandica]|uniref:Uncharacterized protein n=1 Tax=Rhodopirellula islandica TaxID=595434 RepID=A0A0J1B8T0_RHOIS|nr:hypothetical protein RISK_005167 [Rhodopirellula islandica]